MSDSRALSLDDFVDKMIGLEKGNPQVGEDYHYFFSHHIFFLATLVELHLDLQLSR